MRVLKITYDRDYHTVTERRFISSPEEVEDSWTGYNYWYYEDYFREKKLTADEARKLLSKK